MLCFDSVCIIVLSQESEQIDTWGPAVIEGSRFIEWEDLDESHHVPEHVLNNKDDFKLFLHKGHVHFVPVYDSIEETSSEDSYYEYYDYSGVPNKGAAR